MNSKLVTKLEEKKSMHSNNIFLMCNQRCTSKAERKKKKTTTKDNTETESQMVMNI